MIGAARVPGSCGELVQGTIGNINFHISCPVDLYSEAIVKLKKKQQEISGPTGKGKALQAVYRTLKYIGAEGWGAEISLTSSLPPAKGMASSTADIAAACWATAAAFGIILTEDQVEEIALSIEPTDGVIFPGIVIFDHVKGYFQEFIGFTPDIDILAIDPGGEVDTIAFNERDDLPLLNRRKEGQVTLAAQLVREGLIENNLHKIGEGCTISAFANQEILYKPMLSKIYEESLNFGSLGVNIAHSGSVIGVLFPRGDNSLLTFAHVLKVKYPEIKKIMPLKMVDGGVQLVMLAQKED